MSLNTMVIGFLTVPFVAGLLFAALIEIDEGSRTARVARILCYGIVGIVFTAWTVFFWNNLGRDVGSFFESLGLALFPTFFASISAICWCSAQTRSSKTKHRELWRSVPIKTRYRHP
jgi:hypothetical protein